MKKLTYILAAVLVALVVGLASCSKSNSDLIKDYEKKAKEAIEALQNGDMEKFEELKKEATDIMNELNGKELSESEQEELQKTQTNLIQDAVKAAGAMGNPFGDLDGVVGAGEIIEAVGDGASEIIEETVVAGSGIEDAVKSAAQDKVDEIKDKANDKANEIKDKANGAVDDAVNNAKNRLGL